MGMGENDPNAQYISLYQSSYSRNIPSSNKIQFWYAGIRKVLKMNLDPGSEEFVDTADYSNEDFRNKKQNFQVVLGKPEKILF